MPSAKFKTLVAATRAGEVALELLVINQPSLLEPVRLVNDNQDFMCCGLLYRACAFKLTWPDDVDGRVPSANLEVDNIGRELVEPIQATQGLARAKLTLRMALRSESEVIQREITLDLNGVRINQSVISGTLGFANMLDVPAVMERFTPDVAPGLF